MKASPVALMLILVATGGAALAGPQTAPVRMLGPGVISTPANEFGGTMSPDGKEIYFSRSVPRSYMYAIFESHRIGGRWSAPRLAPFSGRGRDFDPHFSPDGRRMVFTSDRPVEERKAKHDYDIWMVERSRSGWAAPRNLGAPVDISADNGEGNEWFASLAADGTLYFSADDRAGGGKMRIYRSRLVDNRYGAPQELGPVINADDFDGEPTIAPDQSFLLFSAFGHKGGFGNWDIYISRALPDGGWSEPENLGPSVNTAERDYSPRLFPDGRRLIFTSERYRGADRKRPMSYGDFKASLTDPLNGSGNIYTVDLAALGLKTFRDLQRPMPPGEPRP